MSAPTTLDSSGRPRPAAARSGYRPGRPARTKGRRYPPDPPRAEEIIAVMRCCSDGLHGLRARGLVKQKREWYRQHPDYPTSLGAFDWELPEETHADFFVGDMAIWWLETMPQRDQPLFMQIGFPGPHPPYDPVPRYAQPYLARELPLPTVTAEQIAQQPPPFQEMRIENSQQDKDSLLHSLNPTKEQMHRQRAYYLANVTMIDEKVGQILETLEARGYLENAVVIFTSDHGDALSARPRDSRGARPRPRQRPRVQRVRDGADARDLVRRVHRRPGHASPVWRRQGCQRSARPHQKRYIA